VEVEDNSTQLRKERELGGVVNEKSSNGISRKPVSNGKSA
jgi:hypothetical protein